MAHVDRPNGEDDGEGSDSHPAPTEEVDDLASKVGMLGVRTFAADSHYLGSSSAFAFSRLVSSYLRDVAPKKPPGAVGPPEEQAVPPSPCPLPEYDDATQLSNAYFQNIHPQYAFLHEPTFRAWETKLVWPLGNLDLSNFEPLPLFFLYIDTKILTRDTTKVYAIGALLIRDSEALAEVLQYGIVVIPGFSEILADSE
ncbi:hypothetical protein N7492_008379 [Penicillium capsulatum]|uniref:Uncharacterized protein n=1 Tax=Penicillium capsulatum TaxID=69766 RepID=A0A9W9LFV7_9EURO|nr:hypothetical protein N7492_008379 [Penicillium capsulatum]KAJ6105781.1 hypothetical protein N7512_009298 [Penicillium capsulatum]